MTGHQRSWWELDRDDTEAVVVHVECSCGGVSADIATTKEERDLDVTAAFRSHLDSLKLRG